jgi:hypothetical protein
MHRRGNSADAADFVCVLAFSAAGLLLNGLALMVQGDDGRRPGVALIAGALAMVALRLASRV